MSVIYFLIIIGILVAGGFLLAFIWAVRSGQYDDDYTPLRLSLILLCSLEFCSFSGG
ncbi:MAG: cbb3-type cytochrome oxidase assembly protein CcoS [Bacteroidales bacterium]|nr:cbb3-type cytochrome oxidase assembly protein CcoS [Bacteroidales bacterium]